jgi:hypothetical protein
LEATLSRVDEAINRMERLLTDGSQEGVVRKIENTLSPAASEVLLARVRSLREMAGRMAQTFSLQSHPLDIRRVLDAEASTMWVLFENCRPERMKGYGQVFAKEAREALEKNVESLLAETLKLRRALE